MTQMLHRKARQGEKDKADERKARAREASRSLAEEMVGTTTMTMQRLPQRSNKRSNRSKLSCPKPHCHSPRPKQLLHSISRSRQFQGRGQASSWEEQIPEVQRR